MKTYNFFKILFFVLGFISCWIIITLVGVVYIGGEGLGNIK